MVVLDLKTVEWEGVEQCSHPVGVVVGSVGTKRDTFPHRVGRVMVVDGRFPSCLMSVLFMF